MTRFFSSRATGMLLALVVSLAFSGCRSQEERIDSSILILKDKTADAGKRRAAARQLAEIGEPAIPALFSLLREEHRHALSDVGYAFGRMGPRCLPSVIKALEDEEPFVRGMAASIVSIFGPESSKAVPLLRRILDEDKDEPGVRLAAALALGEIGKEARSAVQSLLAATQEKDRRLRDQAIQSLKKIDPSSLDLIPLQETARQGLAKDFRSFARWLHRQTLFEVGRFEYGRLDLDNNWRLTRDETTGTGIEKHFVRSAEAATSLTFERAGELAFLTALKGYRAGYGAAHPEISDEDLDQMCKREYFQKGIARMLRNSLSRYDLDNDGILAEEEYRAWAVQSLRNTDAHTSPTQDTTVDSASRHEE